MAKKRGLPDRAHCPSGADGSVLSKHLENQGTKKRARLKPEAELVDVQLIAPENRDFTPGRIVTFNIQTGSYALRFLNSCLQILLLPLLRNKLYDKNSPDKVIAEEWHGMTPFEAKGTTVNGEKNNKNKNRALYFNPITGGPASMISETETYLDNQLVQVSIEITGYICSNIT